MGRRWTQQDVDELKEMARRYPAPKIAEKIDRTVGGVVFKAHKLKISLRSNGRMAKRDLRQSIITRPPRPLSPGSPDADDFIFPRPKSCT